MTPKPSEAELRELERLVSPEPTDPETEVCAICGEYVEVESDHGAWEPLDVCAPCHALREAKMRNALPGLLLRLRELEATCALLTAALEDMRRAENVESELSAILSTHTAFANAAEYRECREFCAKVIAVIEDPDHLHACTIEGGKDHEDCFCECGAMRPVGRSDGWTLPKATR